MNRKKPFISLFAILFFNWTAYSQELDFAKEYTLAQSDDFVKDKNFYFLTIIEQIPDISNTVKSDEVFQAMLNAELKNMESGVATCSLDMKCYVNKYIISENEIKNAAAQFTRLATADEAYFQLLIHHARSSGAFQKYQSLSDLELIEKVWSDAAIGINNIISTYAFGQHGRYPNIDSVSYDVQSQYYQRLIVSLCHVIESQKDQYALFFQPSLDFALGLLEMNNRNEAALYEPMVVGENNAAIRHIQTIPWHEYAYSIILVPGHGPEQESVGLSPIGKLRAKLAAERYQKKLAPLLILSGGNVHPFQTRYNEAWEMKKELMTKYAIPEKAILIDPHARHTTTNFRNAARLMFRYGVPTDKMALATTTMYQSYYISDMHLDQRCIDELGYVPFQLYDRLSKFDVEFKPQIESLHYDATDPLDP